MRSLEARLNHGDMRGGARERDLEKYRLNNGWFHPDAADAPRGRIDKSLDLFYRRGYAISDDHLEGIDNNENGENDKNDENDENETAD